MAKSQLLETFIKLIPDTKYRGGGQGGGGSGIRWAESGVVGAESGVEGAGSGGRGAGSLERLGREIDFFNRKFRENGSFRPISYIKVHQGKHYYFATRPK